MDNKSSNDNLKIAGRQYDTEDYKKNDQISSGLATTHEQVSDVYTEGEIKPVIDDVDGKDIEVKKNDYKS